MIKFSFCKSTALKLMVRIGILLTCIGILAGALYAIKKSFKNNTEQLLLNLKSEKIKINNLTEIEVLSLIDYIKENKIRLDNNSEEIRLLHTLNEAFCNVPSIRCKKEDTLKRLGSELASSETQERIRTYLKSANCPTAETVTIRKLHHSHAASGITCPFGIWIKEDVAFFDNNIQKFQCAHEAGHWYYQHSIQTTIPFDLKEYEADTFALQVLPSNDKKNLLARCIKAYHLEPYYPYKLEDLTAFMPKGTYACPEKYHAANFMKCIAQNKNILVA